MNTGQSYKEIPLSQITRSPFNPRKHFDGPKFDELVESVRSKGVIEPILVRNMPAGTFEIVAGERRYRAAKKVAEGNGGLDHATIPAIVRDLSDDAAFDLMTIENLQREDLTELEEAEGFKTYLDKRGPDHLQELSDRTGIAPQYIRRRVSVLQLPEEIVKLWDAGKVKYGHLEQLLRVKDNPDRLTHYIKTIKERLKWRDGFSARQLKDMIDNEAISLKGARFDLKAAGCKTCGKNTSVQKKLFDLGDSKSCCTDPDCFRENLTAYITEHWEEINLFKKHKTNHVIVRDGYDYSYKDFSGYVAKPGEKCKGCDYFVTVLNMRRPDHVVGQACAGDAGCFNNLQKEKQKADAGADKKDKSNGPRVAWHGEFFREQFYKDELPKRLADLTEKDKQKKLELLLAALVKSNNGLNEWFAKRFNIKGDTFWLEDNKIFAALEGQKNLADALHEATIQIIMQPGFNAGARRLAADRIGIDLQKEWRITEEYLQKKTTKEILAMGKQLGVFKERAAQQFLYETLGKKLGKFEKCKKSELVKIFLESGVDLAGRVPAEILK